MMEGKMISANCRRKSSVSASKTLGGLLLLVRWHALAQLVTRRAGQHWVFFGRWACLRGCQFLLLLGNRLEKAAEFRGQLSASVINLASRYSFLHYGHHRTGVMDGF